MCSSRLLVKIDNTQRTMTMFSFLFKWSPNLLSLFKVILECVWEPLWVLDKLSLPLVQDLFLWNVGYIGRDLVHCIQQLLDGTCNVPEIWKRKLKGVGKKGRKKSAPIVALQQAKIYPAGKLWLPQSTSCCNPRDPYYSRGLRLVDCGSQISR